MADAHVAGVLDLRVPATTKIEELVTTSNAADKALGRLGKSLDKVTDRATATKGAVGSLAAELRKLGKIDAKPSVTLKGVDKAATQISALSQDVRKFGDMKSTAKLRVDTKGQKTQVTELSALVYGFGRAHETATLRVDVKGQKAKVAALRADVAALAAELSALDALGGGGGGVVHQMRRRTTRVAASVASGGSSGGGFGGGGGGRRGPTLSAKLPGVAGVPLAGLAALTPVVNTLGGALGALTASAFRAAEGLGAIAAAGIGAAGAGAVGLIAAGAPTLHNLGAALKGRGALVQARQQTQAQARLTPGAVGRQQAQQVLAVQQAEMGLTAAQQGAKQAQDALTQARRDAVRSITDMRFALRSARIEELRSSIGVTQARQQLAQVETNPLATAQERALARLDVRSAVLQRDQSRVTTRRARVDLRRQPTMNARAINQAAFSLKQATFGEKVAAASLRDAAGSMAESAALLAQGGSAIAAARNQYLQALSRGAPGTGRLIKQITDLKDAWGFGTEGYKSATPDSQAAQRNFTRMLSSLANTAKRLTPRIGRMARSTSAAAGHQVGLLGDWIAGPETDKFLRTTTVMFDENLGNVRRSLQHTGDIFFHIVEAARPELKQAWHDFERFTARWDRISGDMPRTQGRIDSMVHSFHAWWKLGGTLARTFHDLFDAGQPAGDSLVVSFTHWLDKQDRWLERNPRKVRQFFRQAVADTQSLAKAAWSIVRAVTNLGETLRPLMRDLSRLTVFLDPLMQIATAPGGLALLGAGFGALRKRGGGGKGGGGAGGGVVAGLGAGLLASGRGLFGRVGTGLRSYGGGRNLAGLGRGASAAMAARATTLGVGGALRGGALAVGRRFWPIAALLGAADFASFHGNVGQRAQYTAANFINPFSQLVGAGNLIPTPVTGAQRATRAQTDAATITSRLRGSPAQQLARLNTLRTAFGNLQHGRSLSQDQYTALGHLGHGMTIDPTDRKYWRPFLDNLHASALALHAQARSAREAAHATARGRSRDIAAHHAENLQARYGNDVRRGMTPEAAVRDVVAHTESRLRHLGKSGARVLGQNMLDWLREQRKQNPKLTGEVDNLRASIIGRFKDLGKNISIVNGQILTGSQGEWANIASAISDAADQGVTKTSDAFRRLRRMAIGSLTAMGYTDAQASHLLRGIGAGGEVGRVSQSIAASGTALSVLPSSGAINAPDSHGGRAKGGRLPGRGLYDTVRMSDGGYGAPGELVVNRHTESRVDRLLSMFGTRLGREVTQENRPHYAPMGRATGGRLASVAPLGGVHAGVLKAARAIESRFPQLMVTSSTSGGHAAHSYHFLGEALDIAGGGPAYMAKAAHWIARRMTGNLTEGIHNPGLSVKFGKTVPPSYWGATTWAGHRDHIHIAVAGALGRLLGGGRGMGRHGGNVHLRAPLIGLAGAPGAMAQSATNAYALGLSRKINASIARRGDRGDTGATLPLGTSFAGLSRHFAPHHGFNGAALSPAQVRYLARRAGLPDWFWRIAKGESGFEPGIIGDDPNGYSHGRGLYQMTPEVWSAQQRARIGRIGDGDYYNPWTNTLMAKYLFDHAASKKPRTAGFPWYGTRYLARGGRIEQPAPGFAGWFRNGGSVTASQPTLIGFGDNQPSGGHEVATIHRVRGPHAERSNATIEVTVNMGGVTIAGGNKADSKALADEIGETVARKVTAALKKMEP